jgi:hypothetical protein
MRDFTAGRDINVGRDLYIQEETNQLYKPLAQCTNEELYPEREQRKALLKEERKRKAKRLAWFWLGSEILLCVAALWIKDVPIFSSLTPLFFGIGSLLVGGGAWRAFFECQSPLEQSLVADLQEIKVILGKRGVK